MSATPLQLRQGDVLAKKYEIDAALGSGPTGSSYLARSLTGPKKFVIKLLVGPAAPEADAQAVIQRANDVPSDGLVKVVETGVHQGCRWLAYEYIEGDPLRRLLDEYAGQRKAFTAQEACQIVVKVLDVADAAHARGIVHRHLKPTNVVVQSRSVGPGAGKLVRTIKVTGLGFSEMVQPAAMQDAAVERPFGGYMAPEISSPTSGGTRQADVYSAGVLLYELLCGQTPMGTYLSPTQIREDLPKHIDDIVDLALAANAEDRYPTARDMINDIQRTFQDDDKPAAGLSKRTLAIVIGGTLTVAALAAGVLMLTDPDAGARRKDDLLRAEVAKENPTPDAAFVQQKTAAHPEMVFVPGGTYVRGRMNSEDGRTATAKEPLAERAKVDAFYIDRFEWENQKEGHPVVHLTAEKAAELCASKGKRLCSADEWERACKGPENRIYSYGDTFVPETCGADLVTDADRDGHTEWVSGKMTDCKSGFGVYDMSGGPREWTSTTGAGSDRFRLLKGGKLGEAVKGSRCAYVEERSAALADRTISFRCCLSDGAEAVPADAPPAGDAPPAPAAPAGATEGAPAPQ